MQRENLIQLAKYYRFLIKKRNKYQKKILEERIVEKIQIYNLFLNLFKQKIRNLVYQIERYEKDTHDYIFMEIEVYAIFKVFIF